MIIICLIKIRMYYDTLLCSCLVEALFVLKNRFIDHLDDRLSSDWLIRSNEFWIIYLIDDLWISDVLPCIEVIFRIHWLIGIWTYCHSVTSKMLRLGYWIWMLIHLIDILVAEINVSLPAFARVFVYWSNIYGIYLEYTNKIPDPWPFSSYDLEYTS